MENDSTNVEPSDDEIKQKWDEFIEKFRDITALEKFEKWGGKWEKTQRLMIFIDNYRRIFKHNKEADKRLHTNWLGVNQFSDMTAAEYASRFPRHDPLRAQKKQIQIEWQIFKKKYRMELELIKDYDEVNREQIFTENVRRILSHNTEADKGKHNFWLGVNQFTHMTDNEFSTNNSIQTILLDDKIHVDISIGHSGCCININYEPIYEISIPDNFNWCDMNVITNVKMQQNSPMGAVFAVVDTIESHYMIKNPSEKIAVETDSQFVNIWSALHDSGSIKEVFEFIKSNGLNFKSYSRSSNDIESNFIMKQVKIRGYAYYNGGIESSLCKIVKTIGPIVAMICINQNIFRNYQRGIYYNDVCTNDEHQVVVVVGYGRENEQDYWLIKNSYGEYWGQNGYMKLARNYNMCNIASNCYYPVI